MNHKIVSEAIDACKSGQYAKANAIVSAKCKTKPRKLAYRVGRVVGALADPDGFHKDPDRALKFLNTFKD